MMTLSFLNHLRARHPAARLAGPGVLAAVLLALATPADAAGPAPQTAKPHVKAHVKKALPAARAVRNDSDPDAVLYGRRDDVMAFAAEVAASHGLDPAWVEDQLARARFQPAVTRLIMPTPAGTAKNWAAYRARFVEPRRVAAGLAWWQAHEADLARAEAQFGVPASVVAGIVGVETFYGRQLGHFKVLDALATLSFDFPTGRSDRRPFYRAELASWLVWCQREGRAADSLPGSFAGAVGWPQFMPSSLLRYAIDFDGDGRIDLDNGGADVIGSVASYLASFGWLRGAPTRFAVAAPADPQALATLRAPDILPTFTADRLAALGVALPEGARRWAGPLAWVELQNGDDAPTTLLGTGNFYVITRYNWSAYYAMAVLDLAAALEQGRQAGS